MPVKAPTLASIMTPFPYSIEASATLGEARKMMAEHEIHHLPVKKGKEIIGVVSDSDIYLAMNLMPTGDAPVDVVCTRSPYMVDIREHLGTVVAEMARRHIGSAIVTRQEKLAGILTQTDVCIAFSELVSKLRGGSRPPGDGSAA